MHTTNGSRQLANQRDGTKTLPATPPYPRNDNTVGGSPKGGTKESESSSGWRGLSLRALAAAEESVDRRRLVPVVGR